MTDDELDALMRDAARTYRRPPALGDTDALWTEIERLLPAEASATPPRPRLAVVRDDVRGDIRVRRPLWRSSWLRAAAVLLLGVGLGRASTRLDRSASTVTTATGRATESNVDASSADVPGADFGATSEYLGRTEALLATLPAELRARRADPAYLSRADALLLQTRLLLDSPAAADPTLRSLFDDLEIVLAQVVRLQAGRDPMRVDFLNQAIQQRDVLPRLHDAVADNAGD